MTQIVESLFGVSPERYQEQKDAALQQEALTYAQLNPRQRAEAGIYAGARGLASGIGRMLGGEDPGMRRVTEQDQIIRSINLNDPETYGPAAQRAYQMGHTELAQKILLGADTAYQRQEASRQRAAQMQSRQQTAEAQAMLPNLMREARPEQMVSTDDTGVVNTIPAQAAGIDPDIQRRLMGTAAGQALLKSFAEITKAMQGEVVKYSEGDVGIRTNPLTGQSEKVATGGEKYRAPIILGPGQMAIPANDPRLTGTGVTAPAAVAAAVKPPDKIAIMTALDYPLTPAGNAAYETDIRAKSTVAASTGTLAEMEATGIPRTQEGLALYYRLKEKAPVVAAEARTTEEKNAELIALGAGPKGSDAFNAALRAEVARMTAKPPAAVKAEATTNEITNARAIALGAGEEGSDAFNAALRAEVARMTAKPPAVVKAEATTNEITNARAIALKAGPEGSDAFNAVFFAEMSRMTAKPVAAVAAPPAPTEAMKNADSFAILKGERGTPAYNREFVARMERFTAKSGGGEGGGSGPGGAAGTGTVLVVDPKDKTKTMLVTKQRAVAENLTPAKEPEKAKPLPANLSKQEEDDFDIARDATNLATDAYDYIGRVKSGEIKFSLKDRAAISIQNAFGSENPVVTARNDYDKFIQRLTNDTLRLNKGTQTDFDYKNALKEIKSSESPADVATTLQKLVNLNVRRVKDAAESISRRRKNAGATEVETSIVVPSFDVHVMDSQQEKSFLANPKYPAGTNYINPQGQRMTKTKAVQ